MSITRSQIARQLMAEGGVPRQGYFFGKLVRKVKDDLIPNELKSPAGAIAAALAVDQFGIPLPGGSKIGGGKVITGPISRGIQSIFSGRQPDMSEEMSEVSLPIPKPTTQSKDDTFFGKVRKTAGDIFNTQVGGDTLGGKILSGIFSPTGLSIGAGLLAGAFTKDKEDPLYTGQSVGLNLRDIRKLANITDPRTGAAIGLNFLPETRFRQFTPEQMAETYAATEPVEFTEQRESADTGGRIGFSNGTPDIGTQEDFNKFLKEKMNMDKNMLQERILKDFEEFMKRKRQIDKMPEVKDGGRIGFSEGTGEISINKIEMLIKRGADNDLIREFTGAADGVIDQIRDAMKRKSRAGGGLMNLGGMEMDLRGGGFVPLGAKEKADDVPARLSKNEFVFTADAVRAAGGGSVDRGADLMYKTMKQLENKVA